MGRPAGQIPASSKDGTHGGTGNILNRAIVRCTTNARGLEGMNKWEEKCPGAHSSAPFRIRRQVAGVTKERGSRKTQEVSSPPKKGGQC
jgi:hypothetical protein